MATPQEILDAALLNASGPKRVQIQAESVEQHSLADQMALFDRAAGNAAAVSRRPGLGIRVQKITPVYPGAE